jgi:hypothetical protein
VQGKIFKSEKKIRPSETGKVALLPTVKARLEKDLQFGLNRGIQNGETWF